MSFFQNSNNGVSVQHLPHHMLTYNMHILVCRLSRQELARGCIGREGELWVERGIQRSKSNSKYRTTAEPEKLLLHDTQVASALLHMRQHDRVAAEPGLAVKTFDELVPKYRHNMRSGPMYDTGDAETATQLLGKGKRMAGEIRNTAVQQLVRFLASMPQNGWVAGDIADASADISLDVFTQAHKAGQEILWAKNNARSRTRCAQFMRSLCPYNGKPAHTS